MENQIILITAVDLVELEHDADLGSGLVPPCRLGLQDFKTDPRSMSRGCLQSITITRSPRFLKYLCFSLKRGHPNRSTVLLETLTCLVMTLIDL